MSYTEHDAWLDEKAFGDWPFERWDPGAFSVHADYNYFHRPHGVAGIGSLFYRLSNLFGSLNASEFEAALLAASEVISSAIENSDSDAYVSWINHEVWLPVLDETLIGADDPADLLIQSIDYVGVPDDHDPQKLLSALGLWLIGEWHLAGKRGADNWEALIQAGLVAAEAEYYRGISEGRASETEKAVKRSRKASDARHAANRERVANAESWWRESARGVLTNAEAARQIASEFHVVPEVAARWVRQFSRSTESANSPMQSHDRAP